MVQSIRSDTVKLRLYLQKYPLENPRIPDPQIKALEIVWFFNKGNGLTGYSCERDAMLPEIHRELGLTGCLAKQFVLHPLCNCKQAAVITETPDELYAGWQSIPAPGNGQVDTWQAEQCPASAKDRVTRCVDTGWSFASGAGRHQHIKPVKQRINAALGKRCFGEVRAVLRTRDCNPFIE